MDTNHDRVHPFPFFSVELIKASFVLKKITGKPGIILSGHCETCEKRVDVVMPVHINGDALETMEWWFYSLKADCNRGPA